jgi:hypothetical protein
MEEIITVPNIDVENVSMVIISILNLFVELYQKDAKKLTPMELALNVTKDIS